MMTKDDKRHCKKCPFSDLLSPEECQERGFRMNAKKRWCVKYENYCQRVAWNCKFISKRYGK